MKPFIVAPDPPPSDTPGGGILGGRTLAPVSGPTVGRGRPTTIGIGFEPTTDPRATIAPFAPTTPSDQPDVDDTVLGGGSLDFVGSVSPGTGSRPRPRFTPLAPPGAGPTIGSTPAPGGGGLDGGAGFDGFGGDITGSGSPPPVVDVLAGAPSYDDVDYNFDVLSTEDGGDYDWYWWDDPDGEWDGPPCFDWDEWCASYGHGGYWHYHPWSHYSLCFDTFHVGFSQPWSQHWRWGSWQSTSWWGSSWLDWYACDPYLRWWYPSTTTVYEPLSTGTIYSTDPTPVYGTGIAVYDAPFPTIDDAWLSLADGLIDDAQFMFWRLVHARPYEGAPRLGYAVASGLLGDDDAAITAMRQALRDDPEAVEAVPDDVAVRDAIRLLLDRYTEQVRRDLGDRDGLLMVASLRTLLSDYAAAFFAIDAAIKNGDDDESAMNLMAVLEVMLYESF